MQPRILIITDADDLHSIAVSEALSIRGFDATLWLTSDFPTRSEETLYFNQTQRSLVVQGSDFSLKDDEFDVVWRRRPSYVLDTSLLHPSDRAFADAECGIFRRSLMSLLAPRAFWVNPPHGAARASSKMIQHQAATAVELRMPDTIYTNSPSEVRSFIKAKGGKVVYKPFLPTAWSDGTHSFTPYTALLSDESVIDESLRLTPGIFQELVPKLYEVRLTMMGRRGFAAKVHSQETLTGRLDWRQAPEELRFEAFKIPLHLEEKCAALLKELDLVFGCFDFVVTPEGEFVFLEVNEMGQFLFVERYCGLPLLDAFSSFLIQANVDWEWNEKDVAVRYSDPAFDALILAKALSFSQNHVGGPKRLVEE
ncbi:MAG TPA: hypothetical protein VGS07_17920 [Thermoanaerobaculia bacterium]|jgi:glutathione synthase/RimK-type ligase-like ATP-grasp enzyme|nr:hypothetical protein [Thermoanaerobaculia bacterium]